MAGTHGGKRAGAGKPKGYKHQHTLDKAYHREQLQRFVFERLHPILEATAASARGVQHFVLRDKKGKFEKVTSAEAAIAAMNDPEAVYEFWTRDPSVQAASYLIDQAMDKASQPQQVTGQDGGPVEHVFRWKR